jgi:hypothetical protein
MKIVENTDAFPPYSYFTEVEDKFLNFTPNCRVLPARYFNEPQHHFSLRRRYEPGEHKSFPKGGFEICDINGGIYNFDLNEVVVHPFHLNMMKYFTTSITVKDKEKVFDGEKKKRGRPKMDESLKKTQTVYIPKGTKRGRKPLSLEERTKREEEKIKQKTVSGGRRGRPRKATT